MGLAQTRIKETFKALDTTANAFALTHGLNVPTVYGFVSGSRSPGFDTLVNLCAVEPRISAEYLLRGTGEPLRVVTAMPLPDTIGQLRELQEQINSVIELKVQELGG